MQEEKKFCLWIDRDSGDIKVIPITTPIERCPLGFYVPCYRGTKEEMEERKEKIIRRRRGRPQRKRA
jgi:hypothetical protein